MARFVTISWFGRILADAWIAAETGDSQVRASQCLSEALGQPLRTPVGCRNVLTETFFCVRLCDAWREKDRQQGTLLPIQLRTREFAKLLDEAGGSVGVDTNIVAQ